MDRRAFLATLTGSLLAAPLAAEAQQAGKVWRIGLFHVGLDHVPPSLDGLREGLKTLGYEEGKNLQPDFRNVADEAAARVVAVDLARGRPDLLVAFEDQTLRAAKAATSEIPVVFKALIAERGLADRISAHHADGAALPAAFAGAFDLVTSFLVLHEVGPA